jgi:cation diffusion facilitator family transporter
MSAPQTQSGLSPPNPLGPNDAQRYREAQKVTWVSVAVNIALTLTQIGVGVFAHAQSLVADGFHSLSDLLADVLVLFANFHSKHPADERHPYGHKRIETAASLALGVILAVTGAAILWAAALRLEHLQELPPISSLALWTALLSLLAKEGLFRYMLAVANRLNSPMLVANAWHARSDAASSLVVAIGIGGSLAGYRFLDPVAAVVVGFMILRMGVHFTYQAIMELIDTGVSNEEILRISHTIRGTPGVVGLHDLRTRRMADKVLVDAHMQVANRISVSEGHRIGESARIRTLANHPDVLDVLVHIDVEPDFDHSDVAKVFPARDELLRHLQQLVGNDLPPFERTVLHYLGGRIEAEVFLPASICTDPGLMDAVEQRLDEHLPSDPYFRAVTINCRAAPK